MVSHLAVQWIHSFHSTAGASERNNLEAAWSVRGLNSIEVGAHSENVGPARTFEEGLGLEANFWLLGLNEICHCSSLMGRAV